MVALGETIVCTLMLEAKSSAAMTTHIILPCIGLR